ncbi:hypothetical protein [Tsuneonella suprasediminis]|uniref:hypothetical protein n=1 Tax=Tsuneonella suprasediminis TaxID=2306996 RepID=UPI001058C1E7|nr:hypothetical protein [Tsuneonella suprasediminis]
MAAVLLARRRVARMIDIVGYAAALLSYTVLILALRYARFPTISPATFLVAVYLLQYGPHTLIRSLRDLSAGVSDAVEMRYVLAVTLASYCIALAMLAVRAAYPSAIAPEIAIRGASAPLLFRNRQAAIWLIAISAMFCMAFLAVELAGPPRLKGIVDYLRGTSPHSYTALRRQLFSDAPIELLMNYTRQTVSIVLLLLNVVVATRYRSLRIAATIMAVAVFVFTMVQLNKFPLIYTLFAVGMVLFAYSRGRLSLTSKERAAAALVVVAAMGLIFVLYLVQYRAALADGLLARGDLVKLVFYRAAFAQADALRLWFSEFPARTPFLGIRNYGLLAELLGQKYFNVTSFIPRTYFGADTTYQVGFIGSGYAGFGWTGIAVFALMAGGIASFATVATSRIAWADLRLVLTIALSMNMYFFCSREFSTALLSGGILPLLAVAWWLAAIGRRGAGGQR